jgi:hypothetical protein
MILEKLPIFLKAKIMYSGYIRHPIADIIREYFDNLYISLSQNLENENIYEHLRGIGELNQIDATYILNDLHMLFHEEVINPYIYFNLIPLVDEEENLVVYGHSFHGDTEGSNVD